MTTRPKILLVDDDPTIIENLSSFLQMNGYDPIAAEDGVAALTLLEIERPDVVVLDVNLPKMSGIEVLDAMQRLGDTTPVIVMTAYGRDNDLDIIALNGGAVYYLDKPFRGPNLLARINQIFNLLKVPQCQSVLAWDALRVDLAARQASWNHQRIRLPGRPYDLLVYLMENSRQLLTRRQIKLAVWEVDDGITDGVVARAKHSIIAVLPALNKIIEGRDGGYIFDAKVVRT